jgi:hypothetical protein
MSCEVDTRKKELEGNVVTVRNNRLSSGVSSFGSDSVDELQVIPSEDDELLDDDIDDEKVTSNEKATLPAESMSGPERSSSPERALTKEPSSVTKKRRRKQRKSSEGCTIQ